MEKKAPMRSVAPKNESPGGPGLRNFLEASGGSCVVLASAVLSRVVGQLILYDFPHALKKVL